MKPIAAGRKRLAHSRVPSLIGLALALLVACDFQGGLYVGHSNAGHSNAGHSGAGHTTGTDAAVSDTGEVSAVTVPVTNIPLVGRPLPAVVSEPGIYVQLYRPQGVIDFGAALPYHFTVFNNDDVAYDPWQLSFVFDGAIDHVWNAAIEAASGRYLVQPEPWNAALRPGEVRQFGFVGRSNNRARPYPDPASYRLHGTEVEVTPHGFVSDNESCQLAVEFVVEADGQWWAERRHSFFGEFYLHNRGSEPTDWALQWSMEHRGSSGPGTRSINNWQRLEGGGYYLRASEHEGPIEPGGTRSFGIWGDYAAQPYDLVACPKGVLLAPDPAAEAQRAAYAALSDEEKRAVECGSLVWNGTSFSIPSSLSGRRPACPSSPTTPP